MKATRSLCLATALLAAAGLAACGQPPAEQTPAPAPSVSTLAAAPVIAPAPASASTAALPADHVATRHYKIAITLPRLPAGEQALAEAMRATADNAKRDFLQALPDPEQLPEMAHRQFAMLLDFTVAGQTDAFTSVRETGMQETGGAHPLPIEGAFVLDRRSGKMLALDDLFSDPDAARKAIANFAHDTLLKKFMAGAPHPGEGSPAALREWKANMVQMLNDGTQPTSVNYSLFVVRAGAQPGAPSPGIALVFPPYQVAPYVNGTQTVDVPAAIFAHWLKERYARDFTSGP